MHRVMANATTYTVFMSIEDYIALPWGWVYFTFFVDLGNVLANELVRAFPHKPGYLKELISVSTWTWNKSQYRTPSNNPTTRFFQELWWRCKALAKALTAFAFLSTATAVVLRIGLMASAIFLVLCSILCLTVDNLANFCGNSSEVGQALVHRAVSWIGVHASNLARTKRTSLYLIVAFFGYLILIYGFYGASFNVWEYFFCDGRPMVRNEGTLYYPYLELMELLVLVFVRTRISLCYFPKFITLINVLFLYYHFTNFFPFLGLATDVLLFLTMSIFFLFMRFFELPGVGWNPFSLHASSANNPRQAYSAVFRSDFSLGFDLRSLFLPPRLRSDFAPEEQTELGSEVEPIQFDFSSAPEEVRVVAHEASN
eukprot:TRINITY_DN1418_c0_g4_i6.p1 TRINITY_DN1418_c0_g4~~TRINITY_DN1418_c0_g4_i6.p1  ORF type:complete len:370 (-),score=15.87 TRINITY_DN1418_c0_g4_i6:162-1271(-)